MRPFPTMRMVGMLLLCWASVSMARAQAPFSFVDSIPVSVNGHSLRAAWSGGIHAPQFSTFDLDGDPFPDLFVYDQAGFNSLTFSNQGLPDSVAYAFNRAGAAAFPDDLGKWTLLVDYDCDGKKDIFTRRGGPIAVYKNTGNSFIQVAFPLYSNDGGNSGAIFSRTGSLPAITDIDGDGDVDILVLSPDGSLVWFHRNESQELYGHCDSLVFTLADACWGNYSDGSLTTQPTLGISCRRGLENGRVLHPSGTTLTALDLDGDGDKEVLHANYPAPNLFMLRNGGTPAAANMDSVELFFPAYDSPVNIDVFPAAYFEDVDNDGARDLLVAPFVVQQDEDNLDQSLFYKNTGTDAEPVFSLDARDFLVSEMIDVGAKAHPLLFDVEQDGDLDLLLGNFGMDDTASIWLYRNVGDASYPSFELETRDYSLVSSLGLKDVVPCKGDLDGDGDEDLVLGEQNGHFYVLENLPLANGEAQFVLPTSVLADLDAGSNAKPFLWDADGDGDLDLLSGRIDGSLTLFENRGSSNSFLFANANQQTGWGNVDVQPTCCVGNAAPFVGEFEGQPHLFVANDLGQIWSYDLNNGPVVLDSFLLGGRFLSITGGDLNGDGDLEFVVGNGAGGVQVVDFDKVVGAGEEVSSLPRLDIFPNPASETVSLVLEKPLRNATWHLTDLFGREYASEPLRETQNRISVSTFPAGVYLLRISTPTFSHSRILSIQHQ